MTGDSHNNDDSDFLDEDFVVEDLQSGNEDLEELFDEPAPQKDASTEEGSADAEPDEDDVLFTDHTEGLEASEEFVGREQFAEDSTAQWDGEVLDLDEEIEPETSDATGAGDAESADPVLEDATKSFTNELDSMLSEEDFAIDSEDELELIDHVPADGDDDGISEFEQSGPFVLDDGDGLWSDEEEAADEAEEQPLVEEASEAEPALACDALESVEEMPLLDAASVGEEESCEEPGWEPLPATSMDALSEVDGVDRTDDEEEAYDVEGYEDDADSVYGEEEDASEAATVPGIVQPDLEDVDGHDIYAEEDEEDEAVVVGGPGSNRGRAWTALISLAATLMIIGGAATVVLRPQWFGLSVEPERVERVEVNRPKIDVPVVEPKAPQPKPVEQVGDAGTKPTETGGSAGDPNATKPETTKPEASNPETAKPAGKPETGTGETVAEAQPGTSEPGSQQPTETQPNPIAEANEPETPPVTPVAPPVEVESQPGTTNPVVSVGTPETGEQSWPVEAAPQQPVASANENQLARFGDNLMVGDLKSSKNKGRPVDGVLPGSRAFAQLHNGNYFIGSVKHVATDTITLRVDTGEVTLPTHEIAQLTQLGSADYEELQKATKGFVRLTNNNRLVGGILSKIADDHVILEFRSNRVMLPKSVVGEIVSGEAEENDVRIDTTREEDNWLRQLAERQLGTGRGAEVKPSQPDNGTRSGGPPR